MITKIKNACLRIIPLAGWTVLMDPERAPRGTPAAHSMALPSVTGLNLSPLV